MKLFTKGQIAILKALEAHFDEYPDPPTMQEIANRSQRCRQLVATSLPVFERLGYVRLNRDVRGRLRNRGVILLMALGEEDLSNEGNR